MQQPEISIHPLIGRLRCYGYKGQVEINISNACKNYTQLVYEKPEKTGCTFSVVKNPFWEMVCDGFTIKCLNLHKLKYAICESRIRLVCWDFMVYKYIL